MNREITPKTRRTARKNIGIAILLGFLFGPLGYLYLHAWKPALLNILTLNYLLFGIILVPIHAAIIVRSARLEVRQKELTEERSYASNKGDIESTAD